MSGIHEVPELFWAVEEEGQWMVIVGGLDVHLYVGPFVSAYRAAEWARLYVDGGWGVTMLIYPEDFPGAQTPPPAEPEDPMLEFGDEPIDEETDMAKKNAKAIKTFEIQMAVKNDQVPRTIKAEGHFLTINHRGDLMVCYNSPNYAFPETSFCVRSGAWVSGAEIVSNEGEGQQEGA